MRSGEPHHDQGPSRSRVSQASDYHAHTLHHRHEERAMDNDDVLRLLARIAGRDEGAFRELYRAFSRKLYAYVLRQLSNEAQAEEIVSDTLYEVWKAPERFRGDGGAIPGLTVRHRIPLPLASADRYDPHPIRWIGGRGGGCGLSGGGRGSSWPRSRQSQGPSTEPIPPGSS